MSTAAWAKTQDPELANAIAYITKHPTRYLFPTVNGDERRPAFYDNLNQASNDPARLKQWWLEHKHRGPIHWACATKKSGLVCVDIDMGGDKQGRQSFEQLKAQGFIFDKTEKVESPSGGRHLIYKGQHHFSGSKVGLHIDTPNYFMIAGTIRSDGRAYKLLQDIPPSPLPQWVSDKIKPRSAERRNFVSDAIPLDVFQRMLDATPFSGGPAGLDNRHDYEGWLAFAMDAHEAAGGDEADYMEAFIQWCHNDPHGKAEWTRERIERHWQSFTADPPEGATARTRASWFKLLNGIGHPEFMEEVNMGTAAENFADQDEEPVSAWGPQFTVDDDGVVSYHESPEATAWREKRKEEKAKEKRDQEAKQEPFPEPLELKQLLDGDWPKTEYTLDGLIMRGVVNTFNADGGTGKTTVSTQTGVAVSRGADLFGRKTIQAPVLLVLGEDGEGVTQARIKTQLDKLGASDDFGCDKKPAALRTWCLPGQDMALAKISEQGAITKLPFYDRLDAQMTKTGEGCFVVLDSLIDVVQMEMKDPAPANAFFKRLLTGLCQKHKATILVLAHPSKASMADGSWSHGTLAMKNAVRNCIAMRKVTGKNYRVLWSLKHNYGPEFELRLYFENGIFTVTAPSASTDPLVRRDAAILDEVVRLLKAGRKVVHVNQGTGFSPRIIAGRLNDAGMKPEIKSADVQSVMLKAVESGVLRYYEGTGHSAAHYELVVQEDDGEAAADSDDGDLE